MTAILKVIGTRMRAYLLAMRWTGAWVCWASFTSLTICPRVVSAPMRVTLDFHGADHIQCAGKNLVAGLSSRPASICR